MTQIERVLIAADKFKGSLTAVQVAEHVTAGLQGVRPDLVVEALPVADGGDGTVAAAVAGGFEQREARVTGPLGSPVTASWALRGGTAIVEMAEASGLQLLPRGTFAPLTATTRGTGELLLAALEAGARTIVLGVGGSATNDGGAGMLQALGVALLDADGAPVGPGGGPLAGLARADLSGLDPRLADVEIVLACDVDNPLTGPHGAAAVYGPQKGATDEDVATLDAALARFAQVLAEEVGPRARECAAAPGAGAAGGIGYAALVGLEAAFRPGIEVLMDVLDFDAALARADLVITGEGSMDAQTLHGKAPAGVAAAARAANKRVVAVCGRLAIEEEAVRAAGIEAVYALSELEPDPARSMAQAGPLLERAAAALAAEQLG
ncbi:glycerate kinase [Streptomyces sp. XM4193]|uniref:glycerate kinase n=1 Tax=Streptomyces sp. XM4193 TaxID=2929782 RepID=UPI001FFA874C|nr:glycerate kinase [Streptomyces sp. XM4193]MCK1797215.1 glycerate kinase [Streptomyces sp. XM4193]